MGCGRRSGYYDREPFGDREPRFSDRVPGEEDDEECPARAAPRPASRSAPYEDTSRRRPVDTQSLWDKNAGRWTTSDGGPVLWVDPRSNDQGEMQIWEATVAASQAQEPYWRAPVLVTKVLEMEALPPGATLPVAVATAIDYRMLQEEWRPSRTRDGGFLTPKRAAQDFAQAVILAEGNPYHASMEDMLVDKYQQMVQYRQMAPLQDRLYRELEPYGVVSMIVPIDASFAMPEYDGSVVYLQKMIGHPRTLLLIKANAEEKARLLMRGHARRSPGHGRIGPAPRSMSGWDFPSR